MGVSVKILGVLVKLLMVAGFFCFVLLQTVLDSIGFSIWQIAAEPCNHLNVRREAKYYQNGQTSPSITSEVDDVETSEDEDDDKSVALVHEQNDTESTRLAMACDDGCVRIYRVSDAEELVYNRTLPRVSGETSSPCMTEKLFGQCHFGV